MIDKQNSAVKDSSLPEEFHSLAAATAAYRILEDKKGGSPELYDVKNTAPFTDYFLIVTGRSVTHMQALAQETVKRMAELGFPACHIEGRDSDSWILLDFSWVVVHIFSREAREFYHLERLFPAESRIFLPESIPEDAT